MRHNDKAILRSHCQWVHIRCDGTSVIEYKAMFEKNKNEPNCIEEKWICLNSTVNKRASIFPFRITTH